MSSAWTEPHWCLRAPCLHDCRTISCEEVGSVWVAFPTCGYGQEFMRVRVIHFRSGVTISYGLRVWSNRTYFDCGILTSRFVDCRLYNRSMWASTGLHWRPSNVVVPVHGSFELWCEVFHESTCIKKTSPLEYVPHVSLIGCKCSTF